MTLLTIDQAIAHLREDPGEDVSLYLSAAEQAAVDFLNRQVYSDADTMAAAVLAGTAGDDTMVVNDAIKAGILLILGHLWRNRETVVVTPSAVAVEIPMSAHNLLWPYRRGLGV